MKNSLFIICILIILFKSGNVLSNNNIFNVNNIEISSNNYKNKEQLVNIAFKKGFQKLIERLLLDKDFKKIIETDIEQIKELISYYQIVESEDKDSVNLITKVNIFFDKERIHKFFYQKNILYSDIINTEVVIFPLLIEKNRYFIYSQNYFYKNWIEDKNKVNDLIQYALPVESIESIQKIEKNKKNIYKLDISDFFKEYEKSNIVFAIIERSNNSAKIFLSTKILDKKINKTLMINLTSDNQEKLDNKIIFTIKNEIKDLIKSQNLIDVRTPAFLNLEIKLNKKNTLVEFKKRIKNIDLIDKIYIQQINKDNVFVKIRYLGKIRKIIQKLEEQKINLKMISGQWHLYII